MSFVACKKNKNKPGYITHCTFSSCTKNTKKSSCHTVTSGEVWSLGPWPEGGHVHLLCVSQTQGLKSFREPTLPPPPPTSQVWVPDRQAGTSILPHPHTATGETQMECFPPETHSVHSNIGTSPAPSPSINQSILDKTLLLFLPWGLVSQPQTFTVHTCLPQTVL